jgi:hypothetical protein
MTARKRDNEADVWRCLNARQQAYLQAIFATDQAQEQSERLRAARDHRSRPADEWRWQVYADTLYGHTPLKQRLVDAGVVDPGTGSTFEALGKRGYILVRYERVTSHPLSDVLVYVRLTTKGRKLVRQALGLCAPIKAPVGELREWQWRAPSRLCARRTRFALRQRYGGWLRVRQLEDVLAAERLPRQRAGAATDPRRTTR